MSIFIKLTLNVIGKTFKTVPIVVEIVLICTVQTVQLELLNPNCYIKAAHKCSAVCLLYKEIIIVKKWQKDRRGQWSHVCELGIHAMVPIPVRAIW